MFFVNPFLTWLNASTVVPPSSRPFDNGVGEVDQSVPRFVMLAPPSEIIVPPNTAEVLPIDEMLGLVSHCELSFVH